MQYNGVLLYATIYKCIDFSSYLFSYLLDPFQPPWSRRNEVALPVVPITLHYEQVCVCVFVCVCIYIYMYASILMNLIHTKSNLLSNFFSFSCIDKVNQDKPNLQKSLF